MNLTTSTINTFTTTLHNRTTRFPKVSGDRQVTETSYTVTREGRICGRVLLVDTLGGERMILVTLADLEVRVWDGRVDGCSNPKTGRTLAATPARVETARAVLRGGGLGSWLK